MKKFLISGIILLSTVPLIADAVVVERKIPTNGIQEIRRGNVVETKYYGNGSDIYTLVDVKRKAFDYAKKRAYMTPEKILSPSDKGDCEISQTLGEMGAENVFIEYRFNIEEHSNETEVKIGNRVFRHPHQCVKIAFNFKGKPYNTGWCRSTRPSSIR